MKKLAVLVLVLALGAGAWWKLGGAGGPAAPTWRTAAVTRGTVVEAVSTTGTLEAVKTVLIGTQVSGVIEELLVDFNSRVRKGDVLARLERDVLEARLAQEEASLAAAEASVERARVAVEEALSKEQRLKTLLEQRAARSDEVEAASFLVRSARASLRAEETRVTQAAGAVRMARTNLEYATITSPIDGVVLDRAVDVGQTVAASLQAPTLFTLAEDLRQMRVKAAVDEADIGRIHSGQPVTFTVDAYPERRFRGRVEQRRLGPTVTQNVVTYQVIVATQNPDEALLPGMTANVSVEVSRQEDTLLVPVAALRFQPPAAEGGGKRGPGGGGDAPGEPGQRGQRLEPAGPRSPRSAQVWVLDAQGEQEAAGTGSSGAPAPAARSSGAPAPRAIPVRTGTSDGSLVAVEPLEEGALKEDDLVLIGTDGAGGGRDGPVNPMTLLRGGRRPGGGGGKR